MFKCIIVLFILGFVTSKSLGEQIDSQNFSQATKVSEESFQRSLLFESILSNDLDEVINALDNGEDINNVNDKGWTAAMFAVHLGQESILEELISRDIDLNIASDEGITPLMLAVINVYIYQLMILTIPIIHSLGNFILFF